jgi:hypothetical protein
VAKVIAAVRQRKVKCCRNNDGRSRHPQQD